MTLWRTAATAIAAMTLLAACAAEAPTASDRPAEPSSPATSMAPADAPSPADDGAVATAPGAYVSWEDYDADPAVAAGTAVVLFFHAPWCPDCRATEAALDADGVPDGLTVVKVDFDSATDLRRRYGVTVQHTFVQLGDGGDAVQKWTGSVSGADIASQLV